MHIMIATDGTIDAAKTADIVGRLVGKNDKATVFTVVEIPRGMLDEMRAAAAGDASGQRISELNVEYPSAQADGAATTRWVGDDAVVSSYIKSKVAERTSELVHELQTAGVDAEVMGEEGENAAKSLLSAIETYDVDVLCIGTHGVGRFDGLLGSLSTKLARNAPCPVVLIR